MTDKEIINRVLEKIDFINLKSNINDMIEDILEEIVFEDVDPDSIDDDDDDDDELRNMAAQVKRLTKKLFNMVLNKMINPRRPEASYGGPAMEEKNDGTIFSKYLEIVNKNFPIEK